MTRKQRYLIIIQIVTTICLAAWNTSAYAQNNPIPPNRPIHEQLSGQQVTQTFDFEERTVNFQELPMYWNKLDAGDGYPHYSEGMLDNAHARSGQYSFKMAPNGGSVAYEFDHRRILVKPGGDSQVTGYVFFNKADRCRAQLRCILTDRMGQPIPESERKSKLVGPVDVDDNGWAQMEVYVPGNFNEARYISVSIWFMQEEQWAQSGGISHIYQKNVWAEAWFDDISIYQLPRVVLKSSHDNNLFAWDQTPRIDVEVQGVGTLDYQARLELQDSWHRILHNERWVLTGLEGEIKIRPFEFPSLPAGIYSAYLHIYSNEEQIASRRITFGVLAPLYGDADQSGQGFGVLALDPQSGPLDTNIDMIRALRARLVKLPVWRRKGLSSGAIAMEPDFDSKLLQLLRERIKIIAVFDEVLDEMANKMITPDGTILDLFQQDAQLWQSDLSLLLAQYARQIVYWQISNDYNRYRLDSRIGRTIETIRPEFKKLVGDTILIAPVSATQLVQTDQMKSEELSIFLPRSIPPDQIPSYVDDFINQGFKSIWLTVDWYDNLERERDYSLIDLAKRLVFSQRSAADSVFIRHPWQLRTDSARTQMEPTEAFLVFRTIADLLGGSKYCNELELAHQVHAMIFDNHGIGYLVVWNNNYDPYGDNVPAELDMYLGEEPTMIDIFGNPQSIINGGGRSKLTLNQWPVILRDINIPLAKLRASTHLEPDYVEADISRQEMELVFKNPWPDTIAGSIRFITSEMSNGRRGWEISPQTINFVLRNDQEFRRTISVKFPSSELGGWKSLRTHMVINADRNYAIDLHLPFEIQLNGIDVSTFAQRLGDSSMRIQQIITNESDQSISLRSFMDLPNLEHQELPITELPPGQTTTKMYLIPDVLKWYGMFIRVGLYDPEGTRRVNYQVPIK